MRSKDRHQRFGLLVWRSKNTQLGFIMIEVIIGILIMTLFIGIAMQSMVFASLLKSRAQQYAEAMTWIQQDLEEIKYQATKYKTNILSSAIAANSSSISLISAQDFVANEKIKIGTDSTVYLISSISGNTLTISPNLAAAIPAATPVVVAESLRCNRTAAPVTIATGFADGFRDRITGSDISTTSNNTDITKTSNRSGKQFRFRRTTSIADASPYNVLQIKYAVAEIYGSSSVGISITDLYAEVVPNAAFLCPE